MYRCPAIHCHTTQNGGFSLIELSIVLVVLSLLAGTLLPSINQQHATLKTQRTQQALEAARDALLSYALLYGNLPCPDFESDPSSPTYGLASDQCTNLANEGWLPFKSLGLPDGDGWTPQTGKRLYYRVDPAFTRSNGQTIQLTTPFASQLAVYDQWGNKITSHVERPIAILLSAGQDGLLNLENASFESDDQPARYAAHPPIAGFDDQILWIGRPSLFSTLIRGGRGL